MPRILRAQYPETALVEPPALPADLPVLREHYMATQDFRATHAYDEWVDRCTWCLAIGRLVRNTDAPKTHPGRFCSEPCRDGFELYMRLAFSKTSSPLATVVVVNEEELTRRAEEEEKRDEESNGADTSGEVTPGGEMRYT